MSEEEKKYSEDALEGVEFDDEYDELKNAEFVSEKPASVKLRNSKDEIASQFLDENQNVIGEKIIEKKTGDVIEIKFFQNGKKESYIRRDKQKRIRKAVDYYENGIMKLATEYGPDGVSYKSMKYDPDGTRVSYVDKHKDGTADAIHFDFDGKGSNLIVKMDANKEVIEKRVEK